MDVFTKLFGDFLVFVYHCFDRIVIRGYLTALSRPGRVEDWRAGLGRSSCSPLARSFVCECHTISTMP